MTYTATFSNGKTITRNSKRDYTYAWAVWNEKGFAYKVGFAADRAKAEKAAQAEINYATRIWVSPASPRYKEEKKRSEYRRSMLKTEIVAVN